MTQKQRLSIPRWWTDVLNWQFGIDVDDVRTLRRIASSVEVLSTHLNDVRGRQEKKWTQRYLADAHLSEAYLVYYATANMLKIHHPLREIALSGAFAEAQTLRIADLGCGPGTGLLGSVAWAAHSAPAIRWKYLGIDAAASALSTVSSMGTALLTVSPGLEVQTMRADVSRLRELPEKTNILVMMNALNELPGRPEVLLRRMEGMLTEDGWLILIEPALRSTSRVLLELRDHAVRDGWTVYAPCLRQEACPALIREHDWCHHDMPWDRPPFIAHIDDLLGLVKRSLKFSYVVLNRHGRTLGQLLGEDNPLRVVSELALEKGRSWCFLCGQQGRFRCRRNARDLSPENAAMNDIARYDVVSLEGEERKGEEAIITKQTRLSRLEI